MAKSLSEDIRVRVVEAVAAGASRRQAAARFGVGVSSAIRWVQDWREQGDVRARPQGSDRRSQRIEAEAGFLLEQIERTPDVTLAELQARLRGRGLSVGIGTLWRFFERHGISYKKTAHAAEQARTDVAAPGSNGNPTSTRTVSSLSTRPAPRPRWRACGDARHAAGAASPRCRMDTGKRRPSPPVCAAANSSRRWFSTGQ